MSLDLETGGLDHTKSPIMELAYLVYNNNFKEIERYTNLVKPYGNLNFYDSRAISTHGITKEETIAKGIEIEEVINSFVKQLKLLKPKEREGSIYLVGHNMASFDSLFLIDAFKLCNFNLFDYFNLAIFDTLELVRAKFGGLDKLKKFTLIDSCDYYNISLSDAHRALNDAEATFDLFKHLLFEGMEGAVEFTKSKKFRETFQF